MTEEWKCRCPSCGAASIRTSMETLDSECLACPWTGKEQDLLPAVTLNASVWIAPASEGPQVTVNAQTTELLALEDDVEAHHIAEALTEELKPIGDQIHDIVRKVVAEVRARHDRDRHI